MTILKARKNQCLYLSDRQKEILIGSILGDAYIEKKGKIQIEHCGKQADYVSWKYNELRSISYEGLPSQVVRHDKRYDRVYSSVRFWTRQFFREWRARFYPKGLKCVPQDMNQLSSLTCAVWYMDDGCLVDGRRCVFSADNFSVQDQHRLQEILFNSFGIRTTLKSSGKILVGTKAFRVLSDILRPHIVPSMSYKLP